MKDRQNTELSEIKKTKNEISRLEANFRVLYSKKVEGIITEKDFKEKYNTYNERVTKLKEKVNRYENSKQTYDLRNDVEKLIIEFENCKNFDNTILKKLIEKIEIGKNNKINIIFKIWGFYPLIFVIKIVALWYLVVIKKEKGATLNEKSFKNHTNSDLCSV
mgnify:FL=1